MQLRFWLFNVLVALCLTLTPLAASAQNAGLSAAQLASLKASTVLVLCTDAEFESSGSGFVFKTIENTSYIATNAHVIETELPRSRRVQVVLNPGIPGRERTLRAQILAEDDSRDLAVLSITDDNVPTPIVSAPQESIRETMPVYVLGFPFGDDLATGRLHSTVTITTGTVSSVRLEEDGSIHFVQVDADINEGNSGGPVVDTTGKLIGIATEKIEGTGVGLALPPSQLSALLVGRVSGASYEVVSNENGVAKYNAEIELVDPLNAVRAVSVFVIPRAEVPTPQPNADGSFPQISPQMQEFKLQVADKKATGSIELKGTAGTIYWQQIRLESSDKTVKWTQPAPLRIPN